jgi:hypothetical protein
MRVRDCYTGFGLDDWIYLLCAVQANPATSACRAAYESGFSKSAVRRPLPYKDYNPKTVISASSICDRFETNLEITPNSVLCRVD